MEEFKVGDIVEITDILPEDRLFNDKDLLIGTIFEIPEKKYGYERFRPCSCGCGYYGGDLRYIESENRYGSFEKYCSLFREKNYRFEKPQNVIHVGLVLVERCGMSTIGEDVIKMFKVNSLCIPK